MKESAPLTLGAALLVAGCASTPPPAQEPDNTPPHPTAVIETHVTTNGLNRLFPLEMDERRYVRPTMSREENAIKGTGTFSAFLVNVVGPNDDAEIERLDRKLRWTIDLRKREYTECPIRGCTQAAASGKNQNPQREQPEEKHEPECVMRVARRSFKVTPTGQRQNVNGFDATEYRVAWIVTLKDKAGRTSTSSLKIETWTTPVAPAMRDALRLEQAYARARAAALGERVVEAGDGSVVIPPQMESAMLGYLGRMSERDRASLLAFGKQLSRIKGHPVRTRIDWDFRGDACRSDAGRSASASSPGADNLMSGLAGLFTSKGDAKGAGEPLFSFTTEVRKLDVESVRDGLFGVPAGYRRVAQ